MRSFIFFALIGIIISSCKKEIDMKIPDKERKLTINAVFQKDSIISIHLSKSIGILEQDKDASFVGDAKVLLFENDKFLDQLVHVDSGYYKSSYKAKDKASYKLVVTHSVYPKAQALTRIPSAVSIDKIDTITARNNTNPTMVQYELKHLITFKDPVDEENYYCLKAFSSQFVYLFDTIFYEITDSALSTNPLWLSSTDPVVDQNRSNENYLLFSDNMFNGKPYTLECSLNMPMMDKMEYYIPMQTIQFQLLSVSKDLFLYLVSKQKKQFSGNDPFTEAVSVFNNIENGFGVLGSSATSLKEIKE